jgi:hypothetical protein
MGNPLINAFRASGEKPGAVLRRMRPGPPGVREQYNLPDEFDPESDQYDYKTAGDAGLERSKENNHLGSLDPRTGMVLKGRRHHTWDMMVDAETKMGNVVVKGKDGRYYSRQAK